MSAEALAIALNHSRAKGTAKVVLLGIANHDGDGGAWPSIGTLARYANVDARTVQRAIDSLEKLGEVKRIVQGGGTHLTSDAHRPNLYRLTLRCPNECDRTAQHRVGSVDRAPAPIASLADYGVRVTPVSPGDASVTPRVTPVSPGRVTPVSPEPDLELTTHLPETNSRDRERANACTVGKRRGKPHRPTSTGYCLDCGARVDAAEEVRA